MGDSSKQAPVYNGEPYIQRDDAPKETKAQAVESLSDKNQTRDPFRYNI